jgi:hypothetical protein
MLKVVPCSILSNLTHLSDDELKTKLPPAYFAIIKVVSEMHEDKKEKDRDVKIMIEMARLLKYFKTGRLPGYFKAKRLVEVIKLLPDHVRNPESGSVSITGLTKKKESKDIAERIAMKERCFYNTWIKYLAKKDKSKEASEAWNVSALDFPQGGYKLEDLQCYAAQITPALMCPYFSLPFTVKTEDKELIASAEIKHVTWKPKKAQRAPKKRGFVNHGLNTKDDHQEGVQEGLNPNSSDAKVANELSDAAGKADIEP